MKSVLQMLLLGALMLVGVGCEEQPTYYHYVGTVGDIRGPRGAYQCWDMAFVKSDGSINTFSLNNYPPTWKGMYGDVLLHEDGMCGYTMVSAKEEK